MPGAIEDKDVLDLIVTLEVKGPLKRGCHSSLADKNALSALPKAFCCSTTPEPDECFLVRRSIEYSSLISPDDSLVSSKLLKLGPSVILTFVKASALVMGIFLLRKNRPCSVVNFVEALTSSTAVRSR